MAAMGEAGDLNRGLGDEMAPKQRIEPSDVSARIHRQQDVFRSHSLGWTVPAVGISSDDTAPRQPAKRSIDSMKCGPRSVSKFGDGKDHLSMQRPLFGEKALPLQSFHGGQTR